MVFSQVKHVFSNFSMPSFAIYEHILRAASSSHCGGFCISPLKMRNNVHHIL